MHYMREPEWVGSSLKDLKEFPRYVQQEIGYSLYKVQIGKKPFNAKPLIGLSSGVMEIVSDFDRNTYRAIYVLKMGLEIYVLHCFQKKAKSGIKTPKQEIDLIKKRLLFIQQRRGYESKENNLR